MQMAIERSILVIPAAWLVKLISYAPPQTLSYVKRVVTHVVLHGARASKQQEECMSNAMWRICCCWCSCAPYVSHPSHHGPIPFSFC